MCVIFSNLLCLLCFLVQLSAPMPLVVLRDIDRERAFCLLVSVVYGEVIVNFFGHVEMSRERGRGDGERETALRRFLYMVLLVTMSTVGVCR